MVGAADATTWTPVVGWADETSGTAEAAVYPSVARLGARREPPEVQVERARRQVGRDLLRSGEAILGFCVFFWVV